MGGHGALPTSSEVMPFDFETTAWRDEAKVIHNGKPSDVSDTRAMRVHVYDRDTGKFRSMFWAHVYDPFETWEEWLDYIGLLMTMHGMDL